MSMVSSIDALAAEVEREEEEENERDEIMPDTDEDLGEDEGGVWRRKRWVSGAIIVVVLAIVVGVLILWATSTKGRIQMK